MVNWNARKYTKEEFIEAWKSARSVAEVGQTLGCNKNGSGYYTLMLAAEELGLNKDHMLGRAWSRGQTGIKNTNSIPLKDILVENSTYLTTSLLKKRLIKEGLLENTCLECGQLPEWNSKPLVLQLDHINGNRRDNRLENLRILCGHCHSQTDTFASKNRDQAGVVERNTQRPQKPPGVIAYARSNRVTRTEFSMKKCPSCTRQIHLKSLQCKSCTAGLQKTKISWPSDQELLDMLAESNYTQVAMKLGVSDNAVRKRLKRNERMAG